MWVEELNIENVKCFEKISIKFGTKDSPYKWVNLLGENGGGKSTILQSLGLLLAGPEGAPQLLLRPDGWLRNEEIVGKIGIRVHKGENDPGKFGGVATKARQTFGYTFFITGNKKISIRNKQYNEPAILENPDKILSWLRENALSSKGQGWFAAGYGAFRRLTRNSQIIVPSLQTPLRFTNFLSQFNENEPLAAFERWMVYLDFRIAKDNDQRAKAQRDIGIAAIDRLLPEGSRFSSVSSDGKIWFDVGGQQVSTIGLSDGFRSVLALGGDLVWRLIEAFPNSDDPLSEEGTVLLDELDIHLHPTWQRNIASWLRNQFPNIQFIVATHSPIIAAGAGADAITYCFRQEANGQTTIKEVENIAFQSIDDVLKGDAFGLVSPYSIEQQARLDKYYKLKRKTNRTPAEEEELQMEIPFLKDILSYEEPSDLAEEMRDYIKKALHHDTSK